MNERKNMKRRNNMAMIATLFCAMLIAFLVPAYGQQEVDPTWYNPWTPPASAQPAPKQAARHHHAATVKAASSQTAANLHRKRPTTRKVS